MSNKHINHQHGLTTMNASRPKSLARKRLNKAKAKLRKVPLLLALQEAKDAKKAPKKAAPAPKKIKSEKSEKTAKAPAKKSASGSKKSTSKKA